MGIKDFISEALPGNESHNEVPRIMNVKLSGKQQKELRHSGWSFYGRRLWSINTRWYKSTWAFWKDKNEAEGAHEMVFEIKWKNQTHRNRHGQMKQTMRVKNARDFLPSLSIVILFRFSNSISSAASGKRTYWFMEEYRRFYRPAAGFLNHAVVLSRSTLKCKLEARAAKLDFIFWEGLTQPVQSPALPFCPHHQSSSSVLGYDGGSELLNWEPQFHY